MFGRIAILVLVCITVIGMVPAAEAHWVPTLSGWAYHSIQCKVELTQVSQQKAITECVVTMATVESLCVNQGGNLQPQGVSQAPVEIVGLTPSNQFVVKNKNTAIVIVDVGTPNGKPDDPPLNSSFCQNPTWTNVANLIRSFHSEINTYKCLADPCTDENNRLLVSTVETVEPCRLPFERPSGGNLNGYNIGAKPFDLTDDTCPNCPLPETAVYVCPNPVTTHWD